MSFGRWCRVTPNAPCPACGKGDWCAWSPDRTALKCERTVTPPEGLRLVKAKDGGAIFTSEDPSHGAGRARRGLGSRRREDEPLTPIGATPGGGRLDLGAIAEQVCGQITEPQITELATSLGVTVESLRAVGIGWATKDDLRAMKAGGEGWADAYPEGAYAFPERGGTGEIVGFGLRTPDGRKGSPSRGVGAARGLIIPSGLSEAAGPVLVVEGASDVAAAASLGLTAVGRPSNRGGADHLARLLKGRDVVVLGENDQKATGAWPGRDGAERTAQRLAGSWKQSVAWALPPTGRKDVRECVEHAVKDGLDLRDRSAATAAGESLLEALRAGLQEVDPPPRPKQAEVLVQIALERFRVGLSSDNEAFAVDRDGPNLAIMFRGSRESLRARLAKMYRDACGSVPSSSALTDALVQLEGEALDQAPEPVHLRVADFEGGVVLDLGTPDGSAVLLRESGWLLLDRSPVIFRRTAAMGALPTPMEGGSLDGLRGIINVSSETWPLVLGWLVAAFMPSLPHPVLYVNGEHGTGKTSCARFMIRLIDPGPALVRTPPETPDNWAVTASASWAFVLDNLSVIPQWLSDAMCKVCTGDGWLKRALYTDSALAILAYRRVVAITSIDAGSIRPDLADRMLIADLDAIPDDRRRTERELEAAYQRVWAGALGALLDLVCAVMRRLPTIKLERMPRMADFAEVLAAMDAELGTCALGVFGGQRDRLSLDAIEGDIVGMALHTWWAGRSGDWVGTASELMELLSPDPKPRGWPKSPRGLAGAIRRLTPSMRAVGVEIVCPGPSDKARQYTIRPTAQTAQSPANGLRDPASPHQDRAVAPTRHLDRPDNRPAQIASQVPAHGESGGHGGLGGPAATSSEEEDVEWT